ncbi:MAG: HlyC/CorC family transporter [Actinobacteria bacterium]|nr:HlyC/CorC family transporter [Actinomycetota bacterium]MCB9412463.1 HlyC/CorC family transporter [Actinomycetota bacterium]
MSYTTAAVVALLLLAGNAFFVAAEFALISARRTQLEPRAERGSRAAKVTLRALERVSLMMAGAQLGITLCSIGLGAVAKPAVADALTEPLALVGLPTSAVDPIAYAVSLAIVVFLHMVFGEMVPKNISLTLPERASLILGPPLYALVWLLRPVIWTLNQSANLVLRLLRVPIRDEVATVFTRDEVAGLIDESRRHGLIDDPERDLLTGALDFVEVRAADVAVPLAQLVTVTSDATPRQLEQLSATTGYSRFPVTGADGELRGYVHVKDMVVLPERRMDVPVRPHLIRALHTVHCDDSLRDVLGTMQRRGAHVVKVLDQDREATVGLAMMEDVLEELVGQVAA